jgi:hypothetical protein
VEGFRDNQTSHAGPYKKHYQVTNYAEKKGYVPRENKFDTYDNIESNKANILFKFMNTLFKINVLQKVLIGKITWNRYFK